jgi:Thermostable hemolysin
MQLEATLSHYSAGSDPVGFRLLRRLLGNNPQFCLFDERAPDRAAAENYIADCFARAYGAQVSQFAPMLLGLRCGGSLQAVIGMREAARERLFLEQYLDEPVEQTLSAACARPAARNQIMELGNLASLRPGVCQLVYLVLASALQRAGYRYAVFAGTGQVERIISKLNFSIQKIQPADPSRLGNAANSWGTYYATAPHVLVVDLQESLPKLQQNLLASAVLEIYSDQIDALASELSSRRQFAAALC